MEPISPNGKDAGPLPPPQGALRRPEPTVSEEWEDDFSLAFRYSLSVRRLSVFAALLVLLSLVVLQRQTATSGLDKPATRIVVPSLAADVSAQAQTRGYRMGWFLQPPEPTVASILKTMPEAAKHSDAVLIQREVPWARILAGTPMETILVEDYDGLMAYLRGTGFHVSFLVDPLDGLDRTRESNETRAAGRTLNDPALRALHEQWVELLVARYQPDFFGCASEINSLAARGDPVLFANIRDMCNRLAPLVRSLSPATKFFVSFQVDEAWGRVTILPSAVDHFALSRTFDIDVLGLSSYPSFFFNNPSEIPADYFTKLKEASGKPVLIAEGGWSSAPPGKTESPATLTVQAEFYERFFSVLDAADPVLVIMLLFADLNLNAWLAVAPPASEPERALPFALMGLVTSDLKPKPALAVWDARFKLPFAGQ